MADEEHLLPGSGARDSARPKFLTLLLRLATLSYPREFRSRHGRELVELTGRRCAEERGRRGPAGQRAYVGAAVLDLILAGFRTRAAGRNARWFRGPRSTSPRLAAHARQESSLPLSNVWRDLRFAFRLLVRSPGFSLASVTVLAIGIGGVTLMFSALNAVVLQPLPFEEPDRLVWAWGSDGTITSNSVSAINYWDYREQASTFESLAAVLVFSPRAIITGGDEPERVLSTQVSYNFFSVLGVEPQIGRSFVLEEEDSGSTQVVILSDGFWQRRYGGDPDVVGRGITISGTTYQVVGVLSPDFDYRSGIELWFPMLHDDGYTQGRGNNNFSVFGRLADGGSIEQAQDQVDAIAASLAAAHPDTNERWILRLESMHGVFVGDSRESLVIMLGLVGVLLIACANVAALALARAITRRTEVAVRLSLGAARGQVVRQLLTERALVALAGGVVGLMLARVGIGVLRSLAPADLPRIETMGIDGTVLAFTFAVSLLASLVFGIVPALRGTSVSLSETLKVGTSRGATAGRSGLRNCLVVAQVALSLMLLVASGLLIQSYVRMQGVDPGFDVEHVLKAEMQLPSWRYEERAQVAQAWSRLHERLRAVPGVVSVGAIDQPPIRMGGTYNTIYPVDRPPATPAEEASYAGQRRFASNDYFEGLGIPILTGRAFLPTDTLESQAVVVISKRMADDYFVGESPLGEELFVWGQNFVVVGVASKVREYGLGEEFPRVFYMSAGQVAPGRMQVLIRTAGDPLEVVPSIRQAVWEIDKEIPISGVETMESRISDSLSQPRFRMFLVGLFAAMAMVLAAIGLYGLLAFYVRERTHEMGIRVALGAAPGNVVGTVVRRGMAMVAAGIGIGLVGGVAAGRLMQGLLFDVAPTDATTLVVGSSCLAAVAVVACLIPALRAMRVDPQEVLRVE